MRCRRVSWPKIRRNEATNHVLYGCNRLFHGRSSAFVDNPKRKMKINLERWQAFRLHYWHAQRILDTPWG